MAPDKLTIVVESGGECGEGIFRKHLIRAHVEEIPESEYVGSDLHVVLAQMADTIEDDYQDQKHLSDYI